MNEQASQAQSQVFRFQSKWSFLRNNYKLRVYMDKAALPIHTYVHGHTQLFNWYLSFYLTLIEEIDFLLLEKYLSNREDPIYKARDQEIE